VLSRYGLRSNAYLVGFHPRICCCRSGTKGNFEGQRGRERRVDGLRSNGSGCLFRCMAWGFLDVGVDLGIQWRVENLHRVV
jgi:hypothetical protein